MLSRPTGAVGRTATVVGFLAVTGSTLAAGLLNAVLIALAARRGEIAQVAAYTVMTSVLAVVGVLVGGGSSVLYLSGDDDQRRAVRSQRWLVVAPCLAVSAAAVAVGYSGRGYATVALAAAAGAFLANNLAELSLAQLHRDLRFGRVAVLSLGGKLAALAVFLVAAAPLTVALLVGAGVNLALSEALNGADGPLRAAVRDRPTFAAARRAVRGGRALHAYTLAELLAMRVPAVALSLVVGSAVMGVFGSVTAVFQALLAVLQSSLNVVLSLRTRSGGFRHDAEALSLGAGVLGAAALLLGAPLLTHGVLALADPDAVTWLRVLTVAMPCYLVNRIAATHAIADGRHRRALGVAVALAGSATVAVAVAVPVAGPLGAAVATLAAEAATAVAVLLVGALSRGRPPGPRSRAPGGTAPGPVPRPS